MISNSQKIFTILASGLILSACTKNIPKVNVDQQVNPTPTEQRLKGKLSLKSLLAQSKNISCVYKFTDQENKFETNGKTYISGKKMYQETETVPLTGGTKGTKGFVLSDGEYVYTWSSDKKSSGMKIKIEAPQSTEGKTKTDVAGAQEDMEKEYDMDCSPWKVDESIFKLPVDITFNDLSEMMKNLPSIPSMPNLPTQ